MTRDPERLLSSSSDADALERELLSSLRGESAPPQVKRALWNGIAAGLAIAAPASAVAASTAANSGGVAASTKSGALLLVKWLVVGAIGAGAVTGTYWALQPSAAVPAAAAKPAVVSRPHLEATPVPQPETAPVPQLEVAPPAGSDSRPDFAPEPAARAYPRPHVAKRGNATTLAAESELLRTARAQLRSGDLDGAERTLHAQRKRFPSGGLVQERDVLQIELLRARGDEATARKLANQFLHAHPESPHATRLRSLVEP